MAATIHLDNGETLTVPGPGVLEPALAIAKSAGLGGTIYRGPIVIGYVRRTATAAGGWNAYLTAAGQA